MNKLTDKLFDRSPFSDITSKDSAKTVENVEKYKPWEPQICENPIEIDEMDIMLKEFKKRMGVRI